MIKLHHRLFACLVPLLAAILAVAEPVAEPAALMPKPAQAEWLQGSLELTSKTQIIYDNDATKAEAETLAAMLRPATGLELRTAVMTSFPLKNSIWMLLDDKKKATLGEEGYSLAVSPTGVTIIAATPAGLFYGGQTLRQLLPVAIFAKTRQAKINWIVPCCKIEDQPRFAWRGYMLDYSRHFFDIEYTKHLLDAMAAQKLNVFHMHLTDDDGWRIEIKKYPKLTEIGAWRGTKSALPNTRHGETFERYGGFFSQDQIREIVAYAAKLHINVMPEIDLPGHCLAVCTAYPETQPSKVGDEKSVQGHAGNAISPAKETNYAMVDDIIGELAVLFPFAYVHIGGDEVNHNLWKDCPEIKALIEKEKLGSLSGAQVYFTKRLELILAKHQKKMIGWNEILNGNLQRSTGIMSWTGTGPGYQASRMGFPVVMAPGPHCYFDMGYPENNNEPPAHSWAGLVSPERCYALDPLGDKKGLSPEQEKQILGVQACLWTEYITPWEAKNGWAKLKTPGEHADYKAFPRLLALAEVGWTPQTLRNYDNFAERLGPNLLRLQTAGVTLRVPPPDAVSRKGLIYILPPYAGAEIRYTVDGSDPFDSKTVISWDGKPLKANAGKFRARTWLTGQPSPLHVGARLEAVGKWTRDAGAEAKTQEFDLSGAIDEAGVWRLTFRKTGGKHHLAVTGVELVVDGAVIAKDIHDGGTAGKAAYRVEVPAIPAGAKIIARIGMKINAVNKEGQPEKADSAGNLTLEKAEGLEPAATVATAIGHYSDCTPDKMADFDRGTFFWSDRGLRKGETVTITFAAPITLTYVEAISGKLDSPASDILVNGMLEVSADGITFRKVADFAYGSAKANLPKETVKAVRITAAADTGQNWVVLQDLILK
jgi:hexosaminidase